MPSSYYLIDIVERSNGRGPNLPNGLGFLELAIPTGEAAFGLYRLGTAAASQVAPGVAQPVPQPLTDLLDAAQDYPPALALMRDEARDSGALSRPDFLALVTQRLQAHLDGHSRAPYFQAPVMRAEFGYKRAGDSYWIVNYHPAQGRRVAKVSWVSGDFFVYRDPVSAFAVDEADLARRFLSAKSQGTT